MKTYKIFTLKLKKYLESLGFECIGKEKSWKDPNYSVFLFPYTDEIDSAVSEYLKKMNGYSDPQNIRSMVVRP